MFAIFSRLCGIVKPLEDFEGQPSRSHGDLHPNCCFTAVVLYLCRLLASFEYLSHHSLSKAKTTPYPTVRRSKTSSGKGARERISWIGSHGWFFVLCQSDGQPGASYWACCYCDLKGKQIILDIKATSSASEHLKKNHAREIEAVSVGSEGSEGPDDVPYKRRRLDFTGTTKHYAKSVQNAAICLIIDANLPFSFYENPAFQSMISGISMKLETLPWSATLMVYAFEGIWRYQKEVIR
ncbi:hypothetical protein K456DRAFT_809940 [Colletotrichum gloeosporioides 23]|nr:hypothetical protein K456DRAFT_809940 [Colletotrichum gloeosporioides 23]